MRFQFQAGTSAPAPVVDLKPPCTPPRGVLFRHGALAMAISLTLAGCASSVSHQQPQPWKVEPVLDVRHGAQSSEAYYALGRYHDGSQAWDKAIDAYRKAIAADAHNVEAYNALGVALARLHRFEDAEASLRQAVGIGPDRAHVRSNLGFVLLLAGRPREAVTELQTALTLDGENVTARANLREAMARSAQQSAQPPEHREAMSRTTEVPAPPSTPVGVSAPLVEASAAVAVVPVNRPLLDRSTALAASGPLVAADPIAPMSLPAPQAAMDKVSVQLELSNGNGIKGAAARLKHWLSSEGLQVERLTNRRPYDQQHTLIQYRAGQQEAALRVARALPMTALLDSAPNVHLRSDVRVVLGHDWVRTAACLERHACDRPAIVAAVPQR